MALRSPLRPRRPGHEDKDRDEARERETGTKTGTKTGTRNTEHDAERGIENGTGNGAALQETLEATCAYRRGYPAAARPFHRERASRVYLCLVGAALLLLAVDTVFITHADASFSGIWLVLITLPWTPMLWALFDVFHGTGSGTVAYGWGGYAFGVGSAVVSALLNVLLLGVAARALRPHRGPREPR